MQAGLENLGVGFSLGFTETSLGGADAGLVATFATIYAYASRTRQQGDVIGERAMLFGIGAIAGWVTATWQQGRPDPCDNRAFESSPSRGPGFN